MINYFKGTCIIILILLLVLVSFYGVATEGSSKVRIIFFSVYGSLSGAILIAYWIYAYILEKRKLKGIDVTKKVSKKKKESETDVK